MRIRSFAELSAAKTSRYHDKTVTKLTRVCYSHSYRVLTRVTIDVVLRTIFENATHNEESGYMTNQSPQLSPCEIEDLVEKTPASGKHRGIGALQP